MCLWNLRESKIVFIIDLKRLDKVNTMEYECFNNAEIHSLLSELLIFEDVNVFSKQFLKLLDITYWITFAYFDFFSLFIILDVSCCLGCSPVRNYSGVDKNIWSTSLAAGGGIWITETSQYSENWKCKKFPIQFII